MPEICVRRMEANEAGATSSALDEIVASLPYYNERAKREELAKYQPATLQGEIAHDPDAVLLAWSDDELVGFCISRYDDGLLWLSWFGVRASARGKGVGDALLMALAATCKDRNAHKIWCDTRTENVASQSVLARVGFKRLCELRNHWYGQDFILWEWTPT